MNGICHDPICVQDKQCKWDMPVNSRLYCERLQSYPTPSQTVSSDDRLTEFLEKVDAEIDHTNRESRPTPRFSPSSNPSPKPKSGGTPL